MNKRTRLGDVTLVGGRSWIRRAYFTLTVAAAAIGFVGYLLPAHRLEDGDWHSSYADGGIVPVLAFATIALLASVLRYRGLGAGMLMGLLSTIGSIVTIIPLILVHMSGGIENGIGEQLFPIGVVALFFGGLFVIVEPVLYWTQRLANERLARAVPQLPVARLYS
jgi:Na+/proline symporter